MITSMREHRGYLYLGGLATTASDDTSSTGADPNFVQYDQALGPGVVIAGLRRFVDNMLGRGEAAIAVPSFDGALKPNQTLEEAAVVLENVAAEDLATDGAKLYLAAGQELLRLEGEAALPKFAGLTKHYRADFCGGRRHCGCAGWARGREFSVGTSRRPNLARSSPISARGR
jgi:hypothetical protein